MRLPAGSHCSDRGTHLVSEGHQHPTLVCAVSMSAVCPSRVWLHVVWPEMLTVVISSACASSQGNLRECSVPYGVGGLSEKGGTEILYLMALQLQPPWTVMASLVNDMLRRKCQVSRQKQEVVYETISAQESTHALGRSFLFAVRFESTKW